VFRQPSNAPLVDYQSMVPPYSCILQAIPVFLYALELTMEILPLIFVILAITLVLHAEDPLELTVLHVVLVVWIHLLENA